MLSGKERLQSVTITGADDSTDVKQLMELSKEFPFVEWAILASNSQQGGYRFPSSEWMDKFSHLASHNNMNVSMHLCGRWVRELLKGELIWSVDINQPLLSVANRIQINTHAESHAVSVDLMLKNLKDVLVSNKEFIMQWDGVNGSLVYLIECVKEASALFDTSHGAGVLPGSWPQPLVDIYCGYAGGIGPENVIDQLNRISNVTGNRTFWIDMERRVRTDDDSALDMAKVRSVLEQVSEWDG